MGGTRTVPLCESCHHKAHGRDGRAAWTRDLTSAAMRSMRERLLYTGGRVRYGYRVGDDGRLVEDDHEQAVMGTARELRASGLSLRAVAAELTARGMLTRGGRSFDAKGVARLEAP